MLAAAWLGAAALLWRSVVPDDLALPDLDVRSQFDPSVLAEAERYDRFLRLEFVLSEVALVLVLAAYARWGTRLMRESAAGPIGTGMVLGMLGLAIAWLVQVPFDLLTLWWERRHDLAETGYLEQVFGNWFALGGEFLFICFALLVVMALARRLGRWWWVPAAPVFVGLGGAVRVPRPVPDPRLAPARGSRAARRLADLRARAGPRTDSRSASRTCTS